MGGEINLYGRLEGFGGRCLPLDPSDEGDDGSEPIWPTAERGSGDLGPSTRRAGCSIVQAAWTLR